MMKKRKSVIVAVLPAYNEQMRIGLVLKTLRDYVDEIVVSDDGSTDETIKVAKECGAHVVSSSVNMGAGHATRLGCRHAIDKLGSDVIVLFDADGQHPPEQIPNLIKRIDEGCEFVFTDRFADAKEMPFVKRAGNMWLSFVTSLIAGIRVRDTQSGFKAFKANVYDRLGMISDGYEICSEFVIRVGRNRIKYCQVPISSRYDEWTRAKGTGVKTGVLIFLRLFRFLF